MNPMLTIAVRAARKAGNIITKGYERPDTVETQYKHKNDFVTNIDKAAEAAIIEVIKKSYPTHTIIAEENGAIEGENSTVQWIIDPLDGTNNFVKSLPHFAVSIAVRENEITTVGVIYDPLRNELFTAVRGEGAKLNDTRLRVNIKQELDGAIVATGFPYKNKDKTPAQFNMMMALSDQVSDFRCSGSAALDLAYIAASRLDAYFESGLQPWDIAAGDLIVREAGGIVTDFAGGHDYLHSGNIIAAPVKATKTILTKIQNIK